MNRMKKHKIWEFVERRYKKEARVLAKQPSSHYDNNDYRLPLSGEQEDAMYYNPYRWMEKRQNSEVWEGFHGGDLVVAVVWDVTPYRLVEETSV